ncbi:plasminogen-like [Physella acuta]|uniref:plasminogen-like n=1 Tax=Physella acuta TaxID=109671 RepID=UPI0027DC2A84|nr:plasminogen-like [Physella acuta]
MCCDPSHGIAPAGRGVVAMCCAGLLLLFLTAWTRTSAHLAKEFISAKNEAARSIEPYKADTSGDYIEVDGVLCDKYHEWSRWTECSRKCDQTRTRRCRVPEDCGKSVFKEKRTCTREDGICNPISYKVVGKQKRNRLIEEILYDLLYSTWGEWDNCTISCRQRRQRTCIKKSICARSYIQEERRCQPTNMRCEHKFSLRPDPRIDSGDPTSKSSLHRQTVKLVTGAPSGVSSKHKDKSYNGSKNNDRKLSSLVEELEEAQSSCGIRPKNSEKSYRVVGGKEVMRNSWPWQVAIMTKYLDQYCGGTLIAPRWVLTAAHCVRKNNRKRKLVVRVGEHDIHKNETTQEDIRPEREFAHPDFNYQSITNDIALIKLSHPPSAYTQPGYACLPSPDFKPQNKQLCTIVGWGKIKNQHQYGSDSLQEARIPVVRHQKCRKVFEYNITSSQVCAGFKRGGTDSCAGDSGGPLLCESQPEGNGKYYLYGVTSYGEGCGRKGKYGIYTKVSSYLDWIKQTIRDNR